MFLNIGKDIEIARMKRIQENPNIELSENKWIDYYINHLNGSMDDTEQLRKEFVEEEYSAGIYLDGLVSLDESDSKQNTV